MSTIIGLKELRDHMDEIVERVNQGESFTVVKRSKPVFELRPAVGSTSDRQAEVTQWTRQFIKRYRPAFEALAKK